jgi:hypothetical protein
MLCWTDGFWQGVDVPGEDLSNVTTTRLPFGWPDDPLLDVGLREIERRVGAGSLTIDCPRRCCTSSRERGCPGRRRTGGDRSPPIEPLPAAGIEGSPLPAPV